MSSIEYSGKDNLSIMENAKNYNNSIMHLILFRAGLNDKILDFGAGSGTFSKYIKEMGFNVSCIETDAYLISRLNALGLVVNDDIKKILDYEVDYIYSLNVLEHIEDDCQILSEFYNKLSAGGRLFVYVPAFPLLFSKMDIKVGHYRRYKREDLMLKIKNAGFKIDSCRYADSAGFFATVLYKIIDRSDGNINPAALFFYDKWVFPISLKLDYFLGNYFGKNLYVHAYKG